MNDYRKKCSGAANRKRAAEKLQAEQQVLSKTPTLQTIFSKRTYDQHPPVSAGPSSTSNEQSDEFPAEISDHQTEYDDQIAYWRNVLRRVVAAIKALAVRELPFRGSEEKFGSKNNGNFLMLLEFLAEFDPFLANHINTFGNKGSGSTSYTTKTIYEEFIGLIANKVISTVISEAKLGKYFSLIVDSTPDISYVDQLSFNLRYVKPDGVPVERFLQFIENPGHKAEALAAAVFTTLDTLELNIADCRGQSYDNAYNMSGQYSGLQARIKKENALADYVPCAAHSLNLVGGCAVEKCSEAASFFSLV
ncbi:zinc finger MYM-type protein 1-like [Lycorma delicatula]|uniref:zinc finger MYM-type protein 1-like n=1 Tax=Lycorma delicatula TaxID=130591 RepID=UPI003F5146F4